MGLDIYLYKYENKEETERLEKEYSDWSEANWNKVGAYETLTEQDKKRLRSEDEQYAISLGLNKGGEDPRKQKITIPSSKYPEHYFNVGYFRSSYNDGGINRILGNLDLPTLYDLFPHDDKDYAFRPDWELSLIKTKQVISDFKAKPNLRCFDVSWNDFKNPNECDIRDEKKALEVFLKQKAKSSGSYSCSDGHFYLDEPIKVLGLVQGVKKMLFNDVLLPSVYVVVEGENEWYINALEIVQETIEYVLSQPDKDKFYFHWSS